MSSPFPMPDYGRPNRALASSPILAPRPAAQSQGSGDVSVRSMRLKVLYTFDDENKTNCLARWPQPLEVRTAYLDENTQIGVIELKTCIQAIVTASPELVAKLGQDYTVYAYDYSEYETPLVGQGMLSWVLASSSSTPSAPAHQSRTIVTGRVCKNIMGLFSSNNQETLEVKLRLVPVPTSLQSEYIESMKKYRDISQVIPDSFDPQAWTAFVQANPGFLQQAMQSRSQSPAIGAERNTSFGIEHVQRLMSGDRGPRKSVEGHASHSRSNTFASEDGFLARSVAGRAPISRASSYANAEAGQQLPRMPSPALSIQSDTAGPKKRGRKPGPKGPRTTRGLQKKMEQEKKQATMQESTDPGYGTNDDQIDEGPAKKRAKVVQAEWSGSQEFGKQPESLRVAASTAASVRIHQPTALRPSAVPLDGPPRVPTPIAEASKVQNFGLPAAKTNLRRRSHLAESMYASPYAPGEGFANPSEAVLTSPERSQVESSPVDIASSPPEFCRGSTAPSSPNLPVLPRPAEDSGFMSGSIDDLFEDDEYRPPDDHDLEVAAQYSRRDDFPLPDPTNDVEPQAAGPTPTSHLEADNSGPLRNTTSLTKASGTPSLGRTISSGMIFSSQVPASDPVRPSMLNRSQTWSGHHGAHPASDVAPSPPLIESVERPFPRPRRPSEMGGGSGVRRKAAIQNKLASSVANGEMPPFCENCGAIETPTWRKAWSKLHSGTPEHVVISEDDGGVLSWEMVKMDSNGVVCLYRILKKSLLKTDEGFTEILLCNPCGLWLHTRKCMRPMETWDKTSRGPDEKPKRGGSKRTKSESVSNRTHNSAPGGEGSNPRSSPPANDSRQMNRKHPEPQLPVANIQKTSKSDAGALESRENVMDDKAAAAALQRAIKSSPHKFMGTQHVPIEVGDLTPQPTRRILFPSPTQSQDSISNQVPVLDSIDSMAPEDFKFSCNVLEDTADKENCPPDIDWDYFDEFIDEDYQPPDRSSTPTPTKGNSDNVFKPPKTPQRTTTRQPPTTGDFLSSAAKAILRPPTTPKRSPYRTSQPLGELTPFTAHLNQLLSDANNGSPGSNGFDFPSLPSLRNTPGHSQVMDFDFSQFDSQDLISTDVPMPSSPPAWFGVYEDPAENTHESLWGDHSLPNTIGSPENDKHHGETQGQKATAIVIDENGRASLDFESTA